MIQWIQYIIARHIKFIKKMLIIFTIIGIKRKIECIQSLFSFQK